MKSKELLKEKQEEEVVKIVLCNTYYKLYSVTGIKPLKVMVIHSHVVAHQVFALRLISWLDSVLAYSEGFRALFSRILIEQEVGPTGRKQPSLLENILKHDTVLWKSARSAVHHLLISGTYPDQNIMLRQ